MPCDANRRLAWFKIAEPKDSELEYGDLQVLAIRTFRLLERYVYKSLPSIDSGSTVYISHNQNTLRFFQTV